MPVRRCLLAAVAALLLVSPAAASALPSVLTGQLDEGHGFKVEPASIVFGYDHSSVLGGPDGRNGFDPGTLDWTSYTHKAAVAVGTIWLNRCRPDCDHGRFDRADVTVRVSRPRDGRFTRIRLRYREDGRAQDTRAAVRKDSHGWHFELLG